MTIKAIFSECSLPLWFEVAENLTAQADWQPCYWTARPELEQSVKDGFPDAVFHSSYDAVRGIAPKGYVESDRIPVDEPLLKSLSPHESIVIRMMDRMDPDGSFDNQERFRLYHRLIEYWLGVIKRYEPDIAVFAQAPHLVFDYVLYILCQYTGTETIMFERTRLPGSLLPLARFEDGSPAIKTVYEAYKKEYSKDSTKVAKLSPNTDEYLRTLAGNDYSTAVPFDTNEKFVLLNNDTASRNLAPSMRMFRNWSRSLYRGAKRIAMDRGLTSVPAPPNYLKQSGKTIENSDMSGREWWRHKWNGDRKKLELSRHYDSLTKPVDFDHDYVYVTLSFQPERTTSPLAGRFVNPLLMVDLLSKTIPPGWQLFVKEHPFQLSAVGHGERSRTHWFYDDLASLPNVKLVPMSTPQFDLIDNAKAVAAMGYGTAAWEAVVRGIPALAFGYPWYLNCEGVFDAQSEASCREAFEIISNGYRVNSEKVRLFVKAIEDAGLKAYVDPVQGRAAEIDYDENVLILTQALKEAGARQSEVNPENGTAVQRA